MSCEIISTSIISKESHSSFAVHVKTAIPTMRNHVPTAREHQQGVLLVLLVSLVWVLSAVLIQHIFSLYNRPYLMSFISCTSFSSLLLPEFFKATSKQHLPQTALFSARLQPFFFITIYTYNVGLAITSVASSSTISTLTTLFSLALGAFVGTERFTIGKVIATLMTVLGVAIISSDDGTYKVLGDLLSLLSAFTYAVYSVMLKHRSTEHGINVLQVQGFMGLITFFTCWPFLFFLHYTHLETFQAPSFKMFALLLFNALCCTVLSEFLFAKSVVLTSPMVSSMAISLTIPMSLIADIFVKEVTFSFAYLIGTALVLAAFLLVNWDIVNSRQKEAETQICSTEERTAFVQSR